jgi:hypothetical protein
MNIQSNMKVFQYLQPYYNWGLISVGLCDRILIIEINKKCVGHDLKTVKEFLELNYFFKDEEEDLYCRYKSKDGDFIKPREFDKMFNGERKEMINRLLNKNN